MGKRLESITILGVGLELLKGSVPPFPNYQQPVNCLRTLKPEPCGIVNV